MTRPGPSRLSWLTGPLVGLGILLAMLTHIVVNSDSHQWDFKIYYGAATAFQQGGDPYQYQRARARQDAIVNLSVVYPPISLHFFGLFTGLDLPAACDLWLALKLAALVALFWLWNRHFVDLTTGGSTALFFALAFNSTIYNDLESGNPALFEQLLLWHGFSWLIRRNPWPLCGYLVLLSQVKATPICLAVLFLVAGKKPYWKPFAVCLIGTATLFASNLLFYPELTRRFLPLAAAVDERGLGNPSSLALMKDAAAALNMAGVPVPQHSDLVLYVCFVAWVLSRTLRAYLAWRDGGGDDPKLVVLVACVVYGLIMPRFKNYTYVLLLVPALVALRTPAFRTAIPLAAAFVLFPHPLSNLPPWITVFFQLGASYVPLLGTFWLWHGYLRGVGSGMQGRPVGAPSAVG